MGIIKTSESKRKKRILIVDDEPDLTYTLKLGLEDTGSFEVDAFNDPELRD
jgi:CheY-like chemotaxis protein